MRQNQWTTGLGVEDGKVGSFSHSLGFSDQQGAGHGRQRIGAGCRMPRVLTCMLATSPMLALRGDRKSPSARLPALHSALPSSLLLSLLAMPEQWSSVLPPLRRLLGCAAACSLGH